MIRRALRAYWQRIARYSAWYGDSWVDVVLGDAAWVLLTFGILVFAGQAFRYFINHL